MHSNAINSCNSTSSVLDSKNLNNGYYGFNVQNGEVISHNFCSSPIDLCDGHHSVMVKNGQIVAVTDPLEEDPLTPQEMLAAAFNDMTGGCTLQDGRFVMMVDHGTITDFQDIGNTLFVDTENLSCLITDIKAQLDAFHMGVLGRQDIDLDDIPLYFSPADPSLFQDSLLDRS
jgi:hypothetical protein